MKYAEKLAEKHEELDGCLDGMSETEKIAMSPVLACLCDDLVIYDELTSRVVDEGAVVETPKGPRANPALLERHKCVNRIIGECSKIRQAASKAGVAKIDRLAAYVAR